MVSYSHINNKDLKIEDGFFIVPNALIADNFIIILSGYLESVLGTRM